jgi:hypothetical protein
VEEEDGPEDCSSKLLSIPFQESPRFVEVYVDAQILYFKWTVLKVTVHSKLPDASSSPLPLIIPLTLFR